MPSLYCAQVKVDDEAFQQGGDEGFIRALRRQLGEMLSRFLIDTKILDGSDGFTMKPDDKLAATECTVRLHVLTPRELEVLVTKAFEAGQLTARTEEEVYFELPRPPWTQGKEPPWMKGKGSK